MSNFRTAIVDPLMRRLGYEKSVEPYPFSGTPQRHDTSSERIQRGTNKGSGHIPYPLLRAFADECEPVRLAIQKRKAQLMSMDWAIVPKEGRSGASVEKQIEVGTSFFETTGGLGGRGRRFRYFINSITEDLLAIGCFSTFRRPTTRGLVDGGRGNTYSVEAIDAGTIKPLLTPEGWIPEPPAPAYEQWIKSKVVDTFTSEQLWYETWDPRTYTRWSRSPVEYIFGSAVQFLKIEEWNLSWFTDGDDNFTYWETPEAWTSQQVKDFNNFLRLTKEELKGQRGSAGALGVAGPKRVNARPRNEAEYSETGLSLWRRIATAFDLNATVLGFEGAQYKVSQQGQESQAERWGNKPLCLLLNDFFTDVLEHDLGLEDVEFKYDLSEEDEEKSARVIRAAGPQYVSINDGREALGLDPAEGPYVDCLYTVGQSGRPIVLGWRKGAKVDAELLDDGSGAGEPDAGDGTEEGAGGDDAPSAGGDDSSGGEGARLADAARAIAGKQREAALGEDALGDLRRWRKKARSRAAAGRSPAVAFASEHIPGEVAKLVSDGLTIATSPDDVRRVFAKVLSDDLVDPARVVADVHALLEHVEEERGRRSRFDA